MRVGMKSPSRIKSLLSMLNQTTSRRNEEDRSHQMIVLSSGMTTSESLHTICNKKKRTLRIALDHHCWWTRSAFSFWILKTSANKDRKRKGTLFCTETRQASIPRGQKAHGPAMTGRFTWNDTDRIAPDARERERDYLCFGGRF